MQPAVLLVYAKGGPALEFLLPRLVSRAVVDVLLPVRDAADTTSLVFGTNGMRRILDHREPVPHAERHDRIQLAGMAREVNRNNHLRLFCDAGIEGGGVDVERVRFDIDEHRTRAAMNDDVGRRRKSNRRGDDLVARADPRGIKGEMQCGGTGVHRHAVTAAGIRGELGFKALGAWTGGEPARAQRLDDGELVFCVDERLMKRQEGGAYRSPAAKRERLTRLDCHGISFIVGDLRVIGQLPRRPPAGDFRVTS